MQPIDLRSDNVAGAHPRILAALAEAATGPAASYGADPWTARLERRLAELFERDCAVLPLATGTAANALALAALTPPWGCVFAHEEAHVEADEANAPEFFTGGAKLSLLPGADGRIEPEALARRLPGPRGVVHHAQPAALTLTQATERGTVYRPEQVADLAALAHRHGLSVHMDGARFANAVAFLGCRPAAVTWQAGIDILSLGATKNGALAAEALVVFAPDRVDVAALGFRRKRAGHLLSKGRFLSAQLLGWLEDGLWLELAGHANRLARRLAAGVTQVPGCRLAHPVEANEVFVGLPLPVATALEAGGVLSYRWPHPGGALTRFVTRWDLTEAEIDRAVAIAAAAAAHAVQPATV